MLGNYAKVLKQSDLALKRATGKACACTYPLLHCAAGQVVAYELGAYVPGVKNRVSYYFDAQWQQLVALPVGANPCCSTRICAA